MSFESTLNPEESNAEEVKTPEEMKAELDELEERWEELRKEGSDLKTIIDEDIPKMRYRLDNLGDAMNYFRANEDEAEEIRGLMFGLKRGVEEMRCTKKVDELIRRSGLDEIEDLRLVGGSGMLRLSPDMDTLYGLTSRFRTMMEDTLEDTERERLSIDHGIEDKKDELRNITGENEEEKNSDQETEDKKDETTETEAEPSLVGENAGKEEVAVGDTQEETITENSTPEIEPEAAEKPDIVEQGPGRDLFARLRQIEGPVKFSIDKGTLNERHYEIKGYPKFIKIVEKGVGYFENRVWLIKENGLVTEDGQGETFDVDVPDGRLMLKEEVSKGAYTKYNKEALKDLEFVVEQLIEKGYMK